MEQQQQQIPMPEQPNAPGAFVGKAPSFMDLRALPNGEIVLFINSVNGSWWFPIDPKDVLPFFQNAVRICQQAQSSLILPSDFDLSTLRT